MNASRFRNLNVYIHAKELVKDVYALLRTLPSFERYALADQMRRAVISVPSNIAEGMGRTSAKDQAHFLEIAFGSLMEIQCQLEISFEQGYLTEEQFNIYDSKIEAIAKMLSGLRAIRTNPNH